MAYAQKFLQSQNLTVLPLSTEDIQAKIQAVWRNDDESALIPMLVDTVRQAYARL
jgi:hypothetical protein